MSPVSPVFHTEVTVIIVLLQWSSDIIQRMEVNKKVTVARALAAVVKNKNR